MKKKTNQIIQILEKTIDLIEKCGGPGGKPGPCPKPRSSSPSAGGKDRTGQKPSSEAKPSAGGKDWPSPKYKNGFDENAFMVGKEWTEYTQKNPLTPHSSGDLPGNRAWFKTGPAKFVNTKSNKTLGPENVEFDQDSYKVPTVSSSTKSLLKKKAGEASKLADRAKELYRSPDHPEAQKAQARASAYSALSGGSQVTKEQYKIIASEEARLYSGGLKNAPERSAAGRRDSLLQQAKEARAIGRTLGIDTHMAFRQMSHGSSIERIREVE